MSIRAIPGDHCEMCLAQIQPDFYVKRCLTVHGNEYLCLLCKNKIDSIVGPRFLEYLRDSGGGCLFDEILMAEDRLNVKIDPPVSQYF